MKQLFLIASTLVCSAMAITDAQIVTVTNTIKLSDLKKFGQAPQFTIHIDGKKIDPGSSISIPASDNILVVRYEYSFLKGIYKGANEVTFKLDTIKKKDHDLNFSWKKEHEPYRVLISGATAIEKKKVY